MKPPAPSSALSCRFLSAKERNNSGTRRAVLVVLFLKPPAPPCALPWRLSFRETNNMYTKKPTRIHVSCYIDTHRRARYARVPGYAIPKGECPVNLRRADALASLACPRPPSARSLRSLPSFGRLGVRVGCSLVASLLYLYKGGYTPRPGACSRLRLLLPRGRSAAGSAPLRQPWQGNSLAALARSAHAAGSTLSPLALVACRWQGKRLQILAALGTAPLACRALVALAADTPTGALAPPSARLPTLRRFECRLRLSLRSGAAVVASPTGRLLRFLSATLCALGLTQSPRQGAMTLPSLRSGSRRCASICGGGALGAAPVVVSSRALRSFPCALAALVSLPRARARDSPPAES